MKRISLILICLNALLSSCGPAQANLNATATQAAISIFGTQTAQVPTAAPTFPPTLTPTPQATSTPTSTPKSTDVYDSKSLGISIEYPKGWVISEEDILITIQRDKSRILLFFFPAEAQSQSNDDPILALESFIQFSSYAMPDKEWVHLITLNDSEYAIGVYSKPGESDWPYGPNPLFMAMHFTEKYTIAAEFDAPPGNEAEYRKIFESVLASLPPSPPRTVMTFPTLAPSTTLHLPTTPEGFHWQGVENIEFALPIPDGWFVKFFRRSETWQSGLQEYDYQYLISKENLDTVGRFSGGMIVTVVKNNTVNAAEHAKNIISNDEKDPKVTKVIDSQKYEQGNVVSYHLQAEVSDDTIYEVTVANKKSNTLYFILFNGPTKNWTDDWAIGQVMLEMLLDLLQNY